MFKYNNTHIFTGYLKQLLASVNLPTCRIYTQEFAEYLKQHGTEDPRVLESFNITGNNSCKSVRINYLKNNELYSYFNNATTVSKLTEQPALWKKTSEIYYDSGKKIPGLTRVLSSHGSSYDSATHEYLGDYLRFMRDYYGINLMSLYNCFNDKICNNIYYKYKTNTFSSIFSSQDSNYKIYAIPVKLFANYTIAIDCDKGVEMFCGLYKTILDSSEKAQDLIAKTYLKTGKILFSQPIIYNKLNVENWTKETDLANIQTNKITRWDIVAREQDLRLFIKVPVSCKSSIVILEGDYTSFNDYLYKPKIVVNSQGKNETVWEYQQNHSVLNFNSKRLGVGDGIDLNDYKFKPISKLQLLAFNTGESYSFADRLVEYLSGSAITPIDPISDNIKRTQRVMEQNNNYFRIEGVWEDKMQNLLYDSIMSSGPIKIENNKIVDKRQGYHEVFGLTRKSTMFDVLGYVDKDTEKCYASYKAIDNKVKIKDNIQNVDIYNGLYDI